MVKFDQYPHSFDEEEQNELEKKSVDFEEATAEDNLGTEEEIDPNSIEARYKDVIEEHENDESFIPNKATPKSKAAFRN